MSRLLVLLFILSSLTCVGQKAKNNGDETLIDKVLADPSSREIKKVLSDLRKQDLSPKKVSIHDSIVLSNTNRLYILSHSVGGNKHYGAVIIPDRDRIRKMPVLILATGGDGMHTQFDITQDFNHRAVRFPDFIGANLDDKFIIVIPSFRGQQLIIGDKKYQSEGNVGDAFDGAANDAIAFLNVALETFSQADKERIAICGGSRGGTVALLASSRDKRIKRTIVIAAPTDMKSLYLLYPDQFKLLFFNDLIQGKITEDEARKKFISGSPIYFTGELPIVQLHHDKRDPFVPVEFAERLAGSMSENGKDIDVYFYDEGIHGFWNDEVFWRRVQQFIRPLTE
ncbi:MAG: prolyl oligopeptidase family serine peptidase [Cytophagales bacterium]|nr:prolyl oligopeptidase family serine peptidase [Cytophagales bacterium]